MAFSYALWAISRNFGLFVIARIIGGISKGNVSLSTAVVADVLPPQKRGKGMVRFFFIIWSIIDPMHLYLWLVCCLVLAGFRGKKLQYLFSLTIYHANLLTYHGNREDNNFIACYLYIPYKNICI